MTQQIIRAADNKDNLSKDDIENIQSKIHDIYDKHVNSTRQIILSQKDTLQASINSISEEYQQAIQIKGDLLNYQKELSSLIASTGHIREEMETKKQQISKYKRKIHILEELKSVSKLNKQIEEQSNTLNTTPDMLESEIEPLIGNFNSLKEKARVFNMTVFYDTKFQQCQHRFKSCFDNFILKEELSISFANITSKKIEFLRYFELIDAFYEFLGKVIHDTFLIPLSQSACDIILCDRKISLEKKGKIPNSAEFIKSSTVLLKSLKQILNNFTIPQAFLTNYANAAIQMSLKLKIVHTDFWNSEASNLCEATQIEKVDIITLMKSVRLPQIFQKCRELLLKDEPFAKVMSEIKHEMGSIENTGVLLDITVMATVIWKEKKMYLQAAIQSLQTIKTLEALECIIMLDKALQE